MADKPDPKGQLEREGKQLAQSLVDTLRTHDPRRAAERAAFEADKEREDKAALEALYRETGQVPPSSVERARSSHQVTFRETGDARYPYEATVDGARWTVRLNEFPEEPTLYSLIVGDQVVEHLMAWPAAWTRPASAAATPPAPPSSSTAASGDDPHEKAEYDRELAHFERTRHIGPSKLVK